jgi:hypothetical protein
MAVTLGDFSRVLDVTKQQELLFLKDWDIPQSPSTPSQNLDQSAGLGSFGNVWSFLGSPQLLDAPPKPSHSSLPTTPLRELPQPPIKRIKKNEPTLPKVPHSAVPITQARELPQTQVKRSKEDETKAAINAVQAAVEKLKASEQNAAKPTKESHTTKHATPVAKQKRISAPRSASPPSPVLPATAPAKVNAKAKHSTAHNDTPAPLSVLKDVSITAPNTPTPKPKPAFLPASVQPLAGGGKPMQAENRIHKPYSHIPRSIEPKVARAPEDKDWDLFTRIMKNFPEDRKTLVAPMNLTTHNNDPNGVHIFVDASNIFIGFIKEMKLSRGIPDHVRIPRADLSFDSLALLMERRRPVAKRVLVGSNPHLPAFDKAKAVGYQCSILEKVEKARQLTDRQVYFKELEEARRSKGHNRPKSAHGTHYTSGNTSGSDTGTASAPQFDRVKKVEQGVDEILHLKICESVLDHPGKPGTIVLATGDAAEAEYSDGFLKTLERALKHGWTVELLSWSRSISALYTKRSWSKQWGDRFRIIPLDEYAEDLLDMSTSA